MDIRVLLPDEVVVSKKCIEAADGDELIAGILYRRGINTPEEIKGFLSEDEYEPFNPSSFEGMQEALKIILKKAEENVKVCIYGDYDVDGITSTVLLKEALEPFFDHMVYHIPHRFTEGYGMNSKVIEALKARGVDLIITCDCGISNVQEIDLARRLGMDVVITDHHTPPDILPPANAILNPKLYGEKSPIYPLPGVGVAYMLVKALYEKVGYDMPRGQWLDLVGLGIIADVVPVLDECRYLLKKGLPYLISPERIGLEALYSVLKNNNCIIEDEEDIAFQIAPRINAAGRMDSPYLPVELLLESNWDRALEKAIQLDGLNSRRKALQNEIFEQAALMVEEEQKEKGILVLYHPDWHEGVLGIVAGKIAEQYKRPCICLTLKDDGVTATGSARSVGDVSIYELLVDSKDYLKKFGGHKQAAGMSLNVENIESFTHHIQGLLPIEKGMQDSIVDIDVEAHISKIDDVMLRRIEILAPFGHEFEKPIFFSRSVEIVSQRNIGKNHKRFIFSNGDERLDGIWWWASPIFDNGELDKVDIVYTLGRNRGRLSLTILNMEKSRDAKKAASNFLHDVVWHDLRGMPIDKILAQYDGALVYYEGIGKDFKHGVDRYGIEKCETLVFLSIPPAPAIFREIVVSSRAKDIVLGFTDRDIVSINQFMRQLQGILKYIVRGKNGVSTIQDLSILMCVPEELIEIALEYLREAGFIDYILEDMGEVTIYKGKKRVKTNKNRRLRQFLHDGFHEMIAFKRYMLSQDATNIENI